MGPLGLLVALIIGLGIGAGLIAGAFAPTSAAGQQPAGQAISVRHSGLCVTVQGGSLADGAPVIQDTCDGAADQLWTTVANADGTVSLRADHSGRCLNIEGGSLANLARAVQWPCGSGANDDFTVTPTDGGFATVAAAHSGRCLDVEAGSAAPGAQLIQYACHGGANQQFRVPAGATPGPDQVGRWGPVVDTPLVPVAGAALPDGKVLLWSAFDRFTFGGARGYTQTAIFDPVTASSAQRQVSNTGHDMFCPGITTLADGRVLVNGGDNAAETSIYDPTTDTWHDAADMTIARGYQATTLLDDGSAFTLGGSWSGGIGNKTAEVWTDGQGWRRLDGVPSDPFRGTDPRGQYRDDNHMWLFGWTDGRVFHAGPSQEMHWIDTSGSGSWSSAGNRANQPYSMNGNAVMYEPGKILAIGGATAYDNGVGTDRAAVIDITGATVTSRAVGSMVNRRTLHNSVVLPTGEVVVTGGQGVSNLFTDNQAVLAAEIFDPQTETFRAAAPMTVPRTYHSISLLLPDGRVLVGGGGLCGSCSTNHADVQIYSPPYLFAPDGSEAVRPRIITAPSSVDLNQYFEVTTNREVTDFALVRLSSATHSVNSDQRRIPVEFSPGAGNLSYVLHAPTDGGVAIPGSYMLFAMDADGVPSVAATLTVTTDVAVEPPPPPPGSSEAIGGSVRSGDGGPVAGVDIDLFEAAADGSRGLYLRSAATGADGSYRFDVDPGVYVLTFIAPAGETFTNGSPWSQRSVAVGAGEERLDVDATLAGGPGGGGTAVGGRVTETGGSPVSGVTVDLFETAADGTRGPYLRSLVTGTDGTFRFDVGSGCYTLTFIAPTGRTFTSGSAWYQPAGCVTVGQERLDFDAVIN